MHNSTSLIIAKNDAHESIRQKVLQGFGLSGVAFCLPQKAFQLLGQNRLKWLFPHGRAGQ